MGKVWLEALLPDGQMAKWIEPAETLAAEDVNAARDTTRVPAIIDDPPLVDRAAESFEKSRQQRQAKTAGYTAYDKIALYIPALAWLRTYKWKEWIWNDLFAGLAVALMVVPQGMSYAQNLAFLPQVYGIYGAFVPCLVYGMLGSSRHLAVGPVAVTSLLLGSGLTEILGEFSVNPSQPNDAYEAALQQRYNRAAIQVSVLAGAFYTLIGLFRLGWLVNFLSPPVISGFMTGAASIIVCTQLKYVTGQYFLPRTDTVYHSLSLLFKNMQLFRMPEFGMGFAFIFILLACQILGSRYNHVTWRWKGLRFSMAWLRFTGPILVTVLSLIIMWAGKLYVVDYNNPKTPIIKDVGPVPRGFPEVTVSWWGPLYDAQKQLILAAIICILDIAESTTVARAMAQEHRYKLDFTQELRALGITNIVGACFNCYTTTGAFSRTSTNSIAGAKTLMSSFVTGITIMIILVGIAPVFQHLSVNVQGAIVIVAVLPLFDIRGALFYWKVDKLDFLTWFTSYFVTMMGGALPGIATAFGLSLLLFIMKAAFPRITTVGQLPGTDLYRDPAMYRDADSTDVDGVVVMRVEAPLFFGNLAVVRDHLDEQIAERRRAGKRVSAVVLDMEPVSDFDGSAAHTFKYILEEMQDDSITLILANPNKRVLTVLQRANLVFVIRPENIQLTMAEAMTRAKEVAIAAEKAPMQTPETDLETVASKVEDSV